MLAESGLATLVREEAAAEKRRKAGKSLTFRQQVIVSLRSLDPASVQFYSTVTAYFRRQGRPNRTYGLFFLFLGIVSLLLCVIHWRQHRPLVLVIAAGYLLGGVLALPMVYHSSATLKISSHNPETLDPETRLEHLRILAWRHPPDPVGALVLERLTQMGKLS